MIKSESFDSISKAIEWCNRWNNKHIRVINIFADEFISHSSYMIYSRNYVVVYEEELINNESIR